MAVDIEAGANGPDTYGWSSLYPARNRKILDGFRDYVQGIDSQDTANCNYSNIGTQYQESVYSSPNEWSYAFNSSITQTPIWTYEYDCYPSWPGTFTPSGSHQAQWFGASNWGEVWQFLHDCSAANGKDYDIAKSRCGCLGSSATSDHDGYQIGDQLGSGI